jgi:hypothetical protein
MLCRASLCIEASSRLHVVEGYLAVQAAPDQVGRCKLNSVDP